MSKTDLIMYGEQELSLLVFNDEYLYNQRHRAGFQSLIDELFIYTDEQLQELKQDLEDDENEEG